VLSLGFGHAPGPVHGHLTGKNVTVSESGVIQILDCCMNGLNNLEVPRFPIEITTSGQIRIRRPDRAHNIHKVCPPQLHLPESVIDLPLRVGSPSITFPHPLEKSGV
jgi:hypothetical protein